MIFKASFLGLILSACVLSAAGQQAMRQPAPQSSIPKQVLKTFNEQYPDAQVKGWYVTHITYWQNDYSSGWYNDWYGPRNVVVYTYSKPTYFEVEFLNKYSELSRSIYNVHGYWYETRTQIGGLPQPVRDALMNSKYANWKVSTLKEKIEIPGWPENIYRFRVTQGLKARILRIDELGNLVQAKYIED